MTSTPLRRHAAALGCVALMAAAQARADTFDLGTISAPGLHPFSDLTRSQPFEDVFTFTIAAGDAFEFHGTASTPFSNRFWIFNLDGRLDRGNVTVLEGDSQTVWMPPFPRQDVTFASTLLTAGSYALHLWGTPTSAFPGPTSVYDVALVFNVAPAVPEPAAFALMALGLAGVVAASRRRH
ncbi:FxDxF family PEP-CTERM protein [Piscinibacter gummiphilus]|uniref:Ice-binding protein C-terminal domain-containing protein n=1 Tax=Piscinibacter gummiphilus TaxID=946333 RepID=A0A1W6L436_9BURK|nr:FxDxF family PEP-CTERM protein [Piscinibacter gummiphilus]ARN19045.1 hypothetical protein A4W93_03420 [Piscinibacter gummiphilus]ATU63690.1 PEP-CTERM sorting domain-containing protein [Piscinibacter gummiphilus]GLS93380.1 hypothetical protein GCM10007918_06710 [Piscinibacter gummiphilus]